MAWITEEPKPEAIQSPETLHASQLRTAELVAGLRPWIGPRLVALAQRHGLAEPESWGLPFINELSDPGEDDGHRARRFQNRLLARLCGLRPMLDYLRGPAAGSPFPHTGDAGAVRPQAPDLEMVDRLPGPAIFPGLHDHLPVTYSAFRGFPLPPLPETETEYQHLARTLLGVDKLSEPTFPPPTVHNVDDPPRRNVGDLTDRQDEELAHILGISPGEWAGLNEEQRIGRMGAALRKRTDPRGDPGSLRSVLKRLSGNSPEAPRAGLEKLPARNRRVGVLGSRLSQRRA
jgi:hypothetical protein